MSAFTLENPVFVTWMIAAALTVLKVMGQGWMTVVQMTRTEAGLVSPEDLRPGPLNASPDSAQLLPNEAVERSRRMHRNDLENIPAFWIAGLLFVAVAPPPWAAMLLMYGFVAARALHAWAYGTAKSHETRAVFYSVGSAIVIVMAVWALLVALF